MKSRFLVRIPLFLWPVLISTNALACAACFGNLNPKAKQGLFAAIFILLGVVLFVLSTIAVIALRWAWRAKKVKSS